jgi:hypothetical protein
MTTQIYGPNTPKVELFIERLKSLSDEEVRNVAARLAAWAAAWDAAWDAARDAAWDAARNAARNEAWDAALDAAWDPAWDAALDTAWDAARVAAAIVVMDLITEEQFTTLAEPFAEILTELGIVWEGK